ncbi:UNVERIFIED_CONTAM: hypothetical protein FKN15_060226 [Acipenser sinensis]
MLNSAASTRVNSPSEQQRDRRRPEIRILAVEPLGPGTWFPGGPGGCASGSAPLGFPPPAHSQGLWGDSITASAQPPPSYDQVIREITHEQVSTTTTNAPPRPSAVTISTQTDCDDAAESSASGSDVTSQAAQSESVPAAVRRPPKPPRPSVLPLTIKAASLLISRESPLISIEHLLVPSEHLLVPESSSVPSECPVVHTNAVSQPLIISTEPLIVPSEPLLVPVSSVVPSKFPVVHTNTVSQPLFVSTESSAVPTESPVVPVEPVLVVEPAAKEGVIIRRPVPRPRLMTSLKPQVKEAQVGTLVELKKDDDDENSKVLPNSIEQSTATYLQELLECFYPEEQSDTDSMNTYGNQRNIRAKIQAFESQTSTDINDGELSKRPEIPLRTLAQKPPVAACRPSLAPKPANRGSGELDTLTESKPDLAIKDGPVFVLPKLQGTQVPFGGKPEPPKKPLSKFMIEINNRNASGDKSGSSIINKLQNEKKKTPVPVPRPKLTKINAHVENTDLIEQAVVPAPRPSVFQRAKAVGSTGEAPEVSHPTPPLQLVNSGLDFNNFNNQITPALISWNSAENKISEDMTDLYFSKPETTNNVQNRQSMQRKPTVIRTGKPPSRCKFVTADGSKKKNEVLVLLQQIDSNSYECQGGGEKGKVLQSRMKIITPLNADTGNMGPLKKSFSSGRVDGDGSGLRGRVLHDFTAEHSDELMLRGGDTVTQLEKLDTAWYRGTCRGRSGIFPVDFIEVEVDVPAATNGKKASPSPASISGPMCVSRFDFEGEHADELTFFEGDVIELKELVGEEWARGEMNGEHADELTFFEGDVIELKELVGEEWARGEMNGQTGIFPLNFVEIMEGLPPPSQQQLGQNKLAISEINQNSFGEIKRTPHFGTSFKAKPEVARSGQWCEALYDFAGQTNEDLSFLKGDRILITEKVDSEWYRGRLNGNEGIFPAIFVEGPAEGAVGANPQLGGSTTGKAKALFDFVSESEEELSFKTGDVITALESVDAEWFCGELHGKCGLFPKNYVQVLQEP